MEGLDEWIERVRGLVDRVDGDGKCYRVLIGGN